MYNGNFLICSSSVSVGSIFFFEGWTFFSNITSIESCQNYSQRPRIGDGWAIYNFLPERLPVNEQKVEIFILLLNR